MREKTPILERSIQNDLATIDGVYAKIDVHTIDSTDENSLIVLAYRLHRLYSAFENIFHQIARTFENQVFTHFTIVQHRRIQWHCNLA